MTRAETATVLEGEALACVRSDRPVFSGLDFRVAAGEALVLVGPNGAGKTSLLRIMAGLLRPVGGRMRWQGEEITCDPGAHARRLRFVSHADALKPALTAAENLAFWAVFQSATTQPAEVRVQAALTAFGLAALADLPGRFLSAGQRRRLALARLLLGEVPLWLLDEPRTGLDAEANERLNRVIAAHRDRGGLVVLALHGGDHPPGAAVLDVGHFSGGEAAC